MDTSRQVSDVIPSKSESLGAAPRQRRSIAEKRRIVEQTLVEGASVARVARGHGINANQVFGWRRLYQAGKTWGAQADDEVAAGSRKRRCADASASGAHVCRLPETTAGHDSHRPAAGAGADRRQRRSSVGARVAGVPTGMMGPPTNTRVWIAAGVTDLRRGFTGLSALVESKLEQKPFSGHVFVFRGRRGDLIKVLWYDGDGLCLFAKRLERGRFVWPQAASGTVSLTRAQLSMLLEGIDWRRPERTWEPQLSV